MKTSVGRRTVLAKTTSLAISAAVVSAGAAESQKKAPVAAASIKTGKVAVAGPAAKTVKGPAAAGKSPKAIPAAPFGLIPFTQPMPQPIVLQPLAVGQPPYTPGDVFHGIAPEYFDRRVAERPDLNWYEAFPTKFYEMRVRKTIHEYIPGVRTPVYGYEGIVPGPTFRAAVGQPCVVRVWNDLDVELSTHLHGGHTPAHSDGYPNFYVLPGRARDYFYPNTIPMLDGQPDFTESPSTQWYHDHAMDVAGPNIWLGLSGFFLTSDALEDDLVQRNVLPAAEFDIPLVLQDRKFNPDGTLAYDPLDHNGTLGDVWIVNGKAQPFFRVQRRKYRFRLLNGCNARILELALSNQQPFVRLGKDTWLYPAAIEQTTLMMAAGQRADVVIDFTDSPDEVFLQNILYQVDGRKPEGTLDKPVHLDVPVPFLKFIVEGQPQPQNATVQVGTALRPHRTLSPAEAVITRVFEFQRRNGAWQINQQYFNPNVATATPTLGSVERWVFRNGGGGWWHPIHVHLNSQQVILLNGRPPKPADRYKSDLVILQGGGDAEVLIHFRTFRGPFVFHCHTVEHEDMRMMLTVDPRVQPTSSPQFIQSSFP